MKKICSLLLILLTYYVAGMYRSIPVLVACAAEAILAAVLVFLPRVLRRTVRVSFAKRYDTTVKNTPHRCVCLVENLGRIPCGRFRFRLALNSPHGKKEKFFINGKIGSRQKSRLELAWVFPVCGIFLLEKDTVNIYDPLGVFHSRLQLRESMRVAVFPNVRPVRFSFAALSREYLPREQRPEEQHGDLREEILQLREYRPGDTTRHIHWNQSARTDSLWVKEYERESGLRMILTLTNRGRITADESGREAFYEILSALLQGLLRYADGVRVIWKNPRDLTQNELEISHAEEIKPLLLELYQISDKQFLDGMEPFVPSRAAGRVTLQFDYDLSFCSGEKLLFRFSAGNYTDEIAQKVFVI